MVNWLGNLNVNNNTYNSALGENAGIIDSAQISDANKLLQSLKGIMPGQTLDGQLVSQDGKSLQLLLGNNTLLNTTLDSQTTLSLGQNLSFEVKSNNDGHLVLRPLLTNVSSETTSVRALESASVNVTEKTMEMVDSLMKEGMPINKEMLQAMNRDMNMYPAAFVDDLVMLHKMNIPVTDSTLEQMHLYNNNNQWMMGNIDNMSDNIIELLSQANGSEDFNAIVDKLEELFGDEKAEVAADDKIIISENGLTPSDDKSGTVDKNSVSQTDVNALNNQNASQKNVFDLLRNLSTDKLDDKSSADLIKQQLSDAIGNKFLMEPEKVADKEYVKKYYDDVLDTVKNLEQFISQNSKENTSIAKDVSQMKGNIEFINQMNELYNYVQLPLKMAGAQAQGDLYVYAKKNGRKQKEEGEDLTALLHLSMETLGNMDIFLRLSQGKLSTDFALEKEEMIDFIEAHIEELNTRLVGKGYNVTTKVGKMTSEEKNVIDQIRSESPQITMISNQAFDARA